MQVELLVFSGRDNPRWELSDAEVHELMERMSHLPPADPLPYTGMLGYRGFLITDSDWPADFPETINIYHGIQLNFPGSRDTRRDEHGLERWLLDQARNRGYSELLRTLGL